MDKLVLHILMVSVIVLIQTVTGQNNGSDTTSTRPAAVTSNTPTVAPTVPTTTLTPEQECQSRNSSCGECLKLAQCLWCKPSKCMLYPTGHVLPRSSDCPLDDARWGVCWVNFKALLISMGVIGGIIIIALVTCICCCCCCKKDNKNKYAKEDEKWDRKKKERKEKADERKAERKARTDEIRRKYGLIKDDNAYQRFDNDV